MKLNFDDAMRYVSKETYQFWSKRCPPKPGDILFTREAPMGEAALIPEGKTICMGQRIMLLRPGKFLSGKYLLGATQAPTFKMLSGKAAVGTGVKHLRVGDVESLLIPICSKEEQEQISIQLDASLSEVDQLDQTIATSLQQAEVLRQSILKKAFSGQLVPQDPHDEPAAALLERIRVERAAMPAVARRSKKVSSLLTNC
jgi:type I restriction enzyme S subunit